MLLRKYVDQMFVNFLLGLAMCLIFISASEKTAKAFVTIALRCPMDRNPNNPTFLSGTNCSVFVTYSGSYAKKATIKIGGETVFSQEFSLFSPVPYWGKTIYFDSTHFSDDTNVVCEFTMETYGTLPFETSKSAKTYNKSAIYGRNEWEHPWLGIDIGTKGATTAKPILQSMNQDVSKFSDGGWSKANILNDIASCTTFYVNTHGDNPPTYFYDDYGPGTPSGAHGVKVYPSDVQFRRASISSQQKIPLIGIAFIDACKTGADNAFALAFLYPYTTYTNGITTNQAEVGWNASPDADTSELSSSTFWTHLKNGDTADQARMATVREVFPNLGNDVARRDTLRCYGDYFATLHRVYTANNTIPQNVWYWY